VRIIDQNTLALPDRPGNNRIDTLRNVLQDPRVSLLFIIPGIGETLRVNGTATISADPELLESFAVNGKPAKTVLLVTVEAAFFHCSKAFVRSDAEPETHLPRSAALCGRVSQASERRAVRCRDLRSRSAEAGNRHPLLNGELQTP
jgi:predicted pyridoxine 5'-phosphate oxidase superfamily flavin-nucleotide-binding protein